MAPHIRTFAAAEEFLAGGKNKDDRPLQRNTRLHRLDKDRIAVALHSTNVVIFHRDGSFVLNTGGWKTNVTIDRIKTYCPIRLWITRGNLSLGPALGHTPPKVQKCRRCKGAGSTEDTCEGPGTCYPHWDFAANGTFSKARLCRHGYPKAHPHRGTCHHGERKSHSYSSECWGCKGTGQKDYGSKPIYYDWDGGPLSLDDCGNPIAPADHLPYGDLKYPGAKKNTGWYAPEYAPALKPKPYVDPHYTPKPYVSGRTVLSGLRSVMPGIDAMVRLPCTCGDNGIPSTVHDAVVHLNDGERWTREQIADWLDSLSVDLRFNPPTT